MKEKFIEIYKRYITREGADDLLAFLEKSDFFKAPASTKYHLAEEGGLVKHSINVFERLMELVQHEKVRDEFEDEYGYVPYELSDEEAETVAIVGLLHDLCKIGFYVPVRKSRKTGNIMPNGKPEWEDYYGYEINDQVPYGHGEKSVYVISGFMKLKREEAMAIRWHMGFSDTDYKGGGYGVGNAFEKFPLAVMTNIADLQATFLDEAKS